MSIRRLEASRLVPVPALPYELIPEHVPFAMVFARTSEIRSPRGQEGSKGDPPDPPEEEPTWSNAETTSPDSNDPSDDEEIDWLQDD